MSESPGHRPSRAPKVAALALLGAGQCRVFFEQVAYARTLMKLNQVSKQVSRYKGNTSYTASTLHNSPTFELATHNQAVEAIDLETHSDRR